MLYIQQYLQCFRETGVEVNIEQTSYMVNENTEMIFQGLLICITVEDVKFPFNLSTTAQSGTAECMRHSLLIQIYIHLFSLHRIRKYGLYMCMCLHIYPEEGNRDL